MPTRSYAVARPILAALALSLFEAGALKADYTPPAGLENITVTVSPPVKICANVYTAGVTCSGKDCHGETITKTVTRTGNSPDMDTSGMEQECINALSSGSVIDNFTFNYIHTATDYAAPRSVDSTSCSSCSGGGISAGLDAEPRVGVVRVHQSRVFDQPSAFGIGVFSSYDINLTVFESGGVTYADCFNPAWLGTRRYSPSGTSFADAIYRTSRSLTLYDAAGHPTTSRASAVRAVLLGKSGASVAFDLFVVDANTTGGRVTSFKAPDGRALVSLTYAYAAADAGASPEWKRCPASVADLYGNTLTYTWSALASGRLAVTGVALPAGRSLAYAYDAQGNLTTATLPGGDTATFARTYDAATQLTRVDIADAGEEGVHRNKRVWFTNNISSDALGYTDRPQVFNSSSMLVRTLRNGSGQLAYYGTNGLSTGLFMDRRVYEGGGRMRQFGSATNVVYKNWSVPATMNAADPFGSISGTKEIHGTSSNYQNYADNRARRNQNVRTPDGLDHAYRYDALGNPVSETVGTKKRYFAYDPVSNKKTFEADFSGNAVLMTYDAAGNMTSRRSGMAMSSYVPTGTEMPGLTCAVYPYVSSVEAIATTTPHTIVAVDQIGLGAAGTPGNGFGLRFEGKLVVAAAGARTFYLSADDRAKVYLDGVNILDRYYSQAEQSVTVNLTAGAHDIKVLYMDVSGEVRLNFLWSGPETGGVKTLVGAPYLKHFTEAGEQTLHDTPAVAEETWAWYPPADPLGGLLKAQTDGTGKRTEYGYDTSRRLIEVKETGDAGTLVTVKTLTYDAAGRVATESDALGRIVTHTYDLRDRRVKTAYADNTTETVLYGTGVDANLVVRRKDRAGAVTKYDYDAAGRAVTVTRGYALADNDGVVTSVLPAPSVETLTYLDGASEVIRRIVDGKQTEYDYDYKARVVAMRRYPAQGKLLASSSSFTPDELPFCETDEHGCRTFRAYRTLDKKPVRVIRELVPGALGTPADNAAVLAVTRDTGANPGYAITDYTLDDEGRTILETDPKGIRTATAYDAKGRVASVTRAFGTPQAQTMTLAYDAAGRPVAQTDALARTTTTDYFPSGRVKKVTYPDSKYIAMTYFADGRAASRTDEDGAVAAFTWSQCCGREFGAANAQGEGTLKFYDGPGRVTYQVAVDDVAAASAAVTWGSGITLPASAVRSAQTMAYDARGRQVASTRWNSAPSAVDPHLPPIAASGSSAGFTTTYEYFDDLTDSRFAPVLAQLAAQGKTLTTGSAVITTNPAGNRSFTVADGAGRQVASGQFD